VARATAPCRTCRLTRPISGVRLDGHRGDISAAASKAQITTRFRRRQPASSRWADAPSRSLRRGGEPRLGDGRDRRQFGSGSHRFLHDRRAHVHRYRASGKRSTTCWWTSPRASDHTARGTITLDQTEITLKPMPRRRSTTRPCPSRKRRWARRLMPADVRITDGTNTTVLSITANALGAAGGDDPSPSRWQKAARLRRITTPQPTLWQSRSSTPTRPDGRRDCHRDRGCHGGHRRRQARRSSPPRGTPLLSTCNAGAGVLSGAGDQDASREKRPRCLFLRYQYSDGHT